MSATCDRFEREGLEALERGEPLGEHFSTCADCLAAAAAYRRITSAIPAALASARSQANAPRDLEAKVWAEVRRAKTRRLVRVVLPAFAALAAGVLLFVAWPRSPGGPSLSMSIRSGQTEAVRGGANAKPGDVLVLSAHTGNAPHTELRVYRDGVRIFRCDGAPACAVKDGTLKAEVPLGAVGHYEAVLFSGTKPVPESAADLTRDLDSAIESGAQVTNAPAIDVH